MASRIFIHAYFFHTIPIFLNYLSHLASFFWEQPRNMLFSVVWAEYLWKTLLFIAFIECPGVRIPHSNAQPLSEACLALRWRLARAPLGHVGLLTCLPLPHGLRRATLPIGKVLSDKPTRTNPGNSIPGRPILPARLISRDTKCPFPMGEGGDNLDSLGRGCSRYLRVGCRFIFRNRNPETPLPSSALEFCWGVIRFWGLFSLTDLLTFVSQPYFLPGVVTCVHH